ncbi:MAG: primosomal protein N', partial [Eubacteriales bacterium]|nr:primosomal protein N' [Eubacteriales bacterium]
ETSISALTHEQAEAVQEIDHALKERKEKIFLLHGVTSSGKTEVYLQSAAKALAMGRSVIVLVPEIALVHQIANRFIGRFGKSEIAILHSKLTPRERFDEWTRLRNGRAHICIGARAAVFAPLSNIGLIILDEEHETSYKSDQTPKYDTVDIAVKRLITNQGVLILGSATPSVVSYERAKEGIYKKLTLKHRYNQTPLPEVAIIDMKEEMKRGNRGLFSIPLQEAMSSALNEGSQVILFQNRRGYSTYIHCEECGEALRCPDCGISLVYHKGRDAAFCHYCGRRFKVPKRCPVCGGPLSYSGVGTEQVEEQIRVLFPDVPCARLDFDTAKSPTAIDRILKSFSVGRTKILVGTQLVAKGLDFKNVGVVGVVSADSSLNLPDYRSGERTFQLVTQVAGRAGRGGKQGKVYVQTFTPESFVLQAAKEHDYDAFFRREIQIRKFMGYPPFSDMILAEFASEDEQAAFEEASKCRNFLIEQKLPDAEKIFPPRISPYFQGSGNFRCQIFMKVPKGFRNRYVWFLRVYGDASYKKQSRLKKKDGKVNMVIDVNPYSVF